MDPEGKIAVVTGAAGGIGGALVRALAERGARCVVAADLDEQGVTALSRELNGDLLSTRGSDAQGSDEGIAQARTLDVTDEQATRALVEEVEERIGPIDVWFANAGVATRSGPEAPDADWERQWRVNVMSHVWAARALLPRWTERGSGHLVTTASMAGILTTAGDAAYATTKHAAVGLAEWLAFTYADQGIRVSCICPGAVDTAMLRASADGDAARASAAIGAGEVLTPEAAAESILDQLRDDRFLILTHPEMRQHVLGKAQDPERWLRGMSRLWARSRALLGDQTQAG
jgi:NAD(P)-dependent dehydrogenase (short-subunit alcohol dehydrogenase family)